MNNFTTIDYKKEIKIEKKIGGGGFGEVFKGSYFESPCAIKKIPITNSMLPQEFECIIYEVKI